MTPAQARYLLDLVERDGARALPLVERAEMLTELYQAVDAYCGPECVPCNPQASA